MDASRLNHSIAATLAAAAGVLLLVDALAGSQSRPGATPGPSGVEVQVVATAGADDGGAETAHVRSRSAIAASLRNQASLLYGDASRWSDVAVYLAHAALLSDFEGRRVTSDLLKAGNLFWQEGERRLACAILRKAGTAALGTGDPRSADRAFRMAGRAGSVECVDRIEAMLGERFVAPPAVVDVQPPELTDVNLQDARIRPVLREPGLPRPPLGALAVRIPPPPGEIQVEPPTIRMPNLEEVRIDPDLRLPADGQGPGADPGGTR